ncbi:unnamed protein product [Rotaria sp. Silwood1]|nr:unnamed protein product [Rotaria sp. Silwood1]CAF1611034.1 unnamed protein product [Rotaria sp. Silwood1]
MGSHSKPDEILIYDKDELILYNGNSTLSENLSRLTIKDDFQCIRVNLSGSRFGLVIKNKNDQFRFVLYPMDLTHI